MLNDRQGVNNNINYFATSKRKQDTESESKNQRLRGKWA